MPPSGLGTAGIVAIPIPAGGAVGEVLTKQSGDNYDFDWAAGGGGGPTVDPGTIDNTILRWVGATPAWEEFSSYILPLADGADGQAIITDGAGTLTFGTVSGGGALSGQYRFSTSIVAADPGPGRFRYDAVAYAAVTQIFIDDFTNQGVDISNILALMTTGDRLYIQAEQDSNEFAVWDITAPATDNVGWFTIDVSLVSNGDLLSNNDRTLIILQIGGALVTLQIAYDNATAVPQITAATGDPISFRAFADPDTIFQLQRNDAGQVMLVESLASGYEVTLGPAGNRAWLWAEPSTISNPTTVQIIPDGRTKTVLPLANNTALIYWDTLFTSNIPGGGGIGNEQGFGAVTLGGTLELLEQGNLFATSIVFNQATRIDVTAANSGPIYTMVNQPQLISTGATNRTVSQANAVRSQLRVQPQSSGDITLTSHEIFFASIFIDSSISTGDAFCTTVNMFAAKAPTFLGVGGAITTLNYVDLPNVPAAGITNIRGINSAMANGLFINHTGVAASFFAGLIELDDDVILQLGDTSGAQFSRTAPSGFTVEGFGGANNEGLDLDFQNDNFVEFALTAGGLGFKMNSLEFAFGSGADPDGTNNWVMIFAPGLRATNLGGDYSEVLFSSSSAIAVAHAIGNFATWTVNAPTISIVGGSIVDAANVLIQTNMGEGTNRYGLLITSNPAGGTLNYALRCTAGDARFDGRTDINNPIALGGGAAATLGTIGGAGPTVAAQVQWLEIDIGGVAHWIPVWT